MSDSMESMRQKIRGAGNLASVVTTLKILAASNISQYEAAVRSLDSYARALELGLSVCFREFAAAPFQEASIPEGSPLIHVVVFGSDQGLVGQFNDLLASFVSEKLRSMHGRIVIWAVGERVHARLEDSALAPAGLYEVPNSVNAITQLVGQILLDCEKNGRGSELQNFFIFHNRPIPGVIFEPSVQKLLPMDAQWQRTIAEIQWPAQNLPELMGDPSETLEALVSEHLFISLYRACAESLASENACRLAAMQRAEKNIGELKEDLNRSFLHLRQASIDEELFDVVSGSEVLMGTEK